MLRFWTHGRPDHNNQFVPRPPPARTYDPTNLCRRTILEELIPRCRHRLPEPDDRTRAGTLNRGTIFRIGWHGRRCKSSDVKNIQDMFVWLAHLAEGLGLLHHGQARPSPCEVLNLFSAIGRPFMDPQGPVRTRAGPNDVYTLLFVIMPPSRSDRQSCLLVSPRLWTRRCAAANPIAVWRDIFLLALGKIPHEFIANSRNPMGATGTSGQLGLCGRMRGERWRQSPMSKSPMSGSCLGSGTH